MKKYRCYGLILLGCTIFLTACNTATPEKYFDVAVLNSNMLVGFGSNGLARELESPSVKMNEKGKAVPMPRSEVIGSKITFTEDNLAKLKGFKETDDNKDILQNSLALHEYVLNVYKKEYIQLARLYDDGASKEKITGLSQEIESRFYARFNELYNKLISSGKLYAERHAIKVNWAM